MHMNHGRSQKRAKEGVLRPKIAKGGGFEGAEALRIHAEHRFIRVLVKIIKKSWANGEGGSDPHVPPLAIPDGCLEIEHLYLN